MKETTKLRLIQLLEKKLGRKASDSEKINAETDFNLIGELTLTITEETADKAVTLDADIKKVDQKIKTK